MTMKTEAVNTPALNIGDVVHCHGGRFRLVECTCDAERAEHLATHRMHSTPADIERDLTLRAFRGEFVGNVNDLFPCGIRGFAKAEGWTVQGNKYAMWPRELAA